MASKTEKHVAIYVRVSTKTQDTKSQLPDLEAWAKKSDLQCLWYHDIYSGKTMDRPGWNKLEQAMLAGKVSDIVIWRIDRLGRTAKGLTALFEELTYRKVNLVSMKEGIDLSTPAGRMMANMLASLAQYETEIRAERVRAGQAVAKKQGRTWGGSKAGVRKKVTKEKETAVVTLHKQGTPIQRIAQAVSLSRPTIYGIIKTIGDTKVN